MYIYVYMYIHIFLYDFNMNSSCQTPIYTKASSKAHTLFECDKFRACVKHKISNANNKDWIEIWCVPWLMSRYVFVLACTCCTKTRPVKTLGNQCCLSHPCRPEQEDQTPLRLLGSAIWMHKDSVSRRALGRLALLDIGFWCVCCALRTALDVKSAVCTVSPWWCRHAVATCTTPELAATNIEARCCKLLLIIEQSCTSHFHWFEQFWRRCIEKILDISYKLHLNTDSPAPATSWPLWAPTRQCSPSDQRRISRRHLDKWHDFNGKQLHRLNQYEQIELQAKLLNYFLGSNKSNINQSHVDPRLRVLHFNDH